jgi:hypothetical protein
MGPSSQPTQLHLSSFQHPKQFSQNHGTGEANDCDVETADIASISHYDYL